MKELLDELSKLKERVDQLRPLSKEHVDKITKAFTIDIIYNSNAIEGNSLTLRETEMVIERGLTINSKPIKDHLEAINLAEAIEYLNELVTLNEELTERTLKELNYLVLKGTTKGSQSAGAYRKTNVKIAGSTHVPVDYFSVQEKKEELFQWYRQSKETLHPVELVSLFHFKLVYIHPFIDGNGRTSRLCMNLILMQHGYPPAVIKVTNREKYNNALEIGDATGNMDDFVQFIAECVKETITSYLHFMNVDKL